MPYYFHKYKQMRTKCLKDNSCPFKKEANSTKCWGYEKDCQDEDRLFLPQCPGDSNGWVINYFRNSTTLIAANFIH